MTNKEAIEVLNMVNKQSKNQPHEFYEALYIAINALEKIDDMICKNCDSGYAQGYSDGYLKGKEERQQGEWISNANGYMGINFGRKCSLCGKTVEFSENFCPNCGAYMRGNNNE